VRQTTGASLRANLALVAQDAALFDDTVRANIALGRLGASDQDIEAAARAANAHDFITALPGGYDAPCGEMGRALSGGQRQRIALARALFGDPVLLVLDEPNSALDQEGSEALNHAIRNMKEEGRSVVIMTHRPVAISECDSLLVVDKGAVKAQGPRDEIIKSMMKNAPDIRKALGGGQNE